MRDRTFSQQLQRKGAGKELVKRAEELEKLERRVKLLGGIEALEAAMYRVALAEAAARHLGLHRGGKEE